MTTAVMSGAAINTESNGDTVLQIIGTAANDNLRFWRSGPNFVLQSNFLTPGTTRVTVTRMPIPVGDIDRVLVLLGDGNDRAIAASNMKVPVLMDGGAGNDYLYAGSPAVLLGGFGNDVLVGGWGVNIEVGGGQRDLLGRHTPWSIYDTGHYVYDNFAFPQPNFDLPLMARLTELLAAKAAWHSHP
jgi:Ca2+-binding RTX toxin-like protein